MLNCGVECRLSSSGVQSRERETSKGWDGKFHGMSDGKMSTWQIDHKDSFPGRPFLACNNKTVSSSDTRVLLVLFFRVLGLQLIRSSIEFFQYELKTRGTGSRGWLWCSEHIFILHTKFYWIGQVTPEISGSWKALGSNLCANVNVCGVSIEFWSPCPQQILFHWVKDLRKMKNKLHTVFY